MSQQQLSTDNNLLDHSYEYSVINTNFDQGNKLQINHDLNSRQQTRNHIDYNEYTTNAYNNDYVQVNINKTNGQTIPVVDEENKNFNYLLSSPMQTINQVVLAKSKTAAINTINNKNINNNDYNKSNNNKHLRTDLDKLPPQIEISLYGTETILDNNMTNMETMNHIKNNKTYNVFNNETNQIINNNETEKPPHPPIFSTLEHKSRRKLKNR
jgi:hypothetical protein